MNNRNSILTTGVFLLVFLPAIILSKTYAQNSFGKLKIVIVHTANHRVLSMNDSSYLNCFNENYSISKLKYYLGNFTINGHSLLEKKSTYFLIDAKKKENVISFDHLDSGKYLNISFDLGVDSIDNCSGAQEGPLDPLNDMFWTWNSGYVFFKLEGNSPSSNADLNRIQLHLGGYKNEENIYTPILLSCDTFDKASNAINILPGKVTEIVIEMNVDNFWQKDINNRISEIPVCMSPGALAKKVARSFLKLFSIQSIVNH